ncbi:MAG: hypothetical protein HFE46_00095 [Clostridia bacterium]|nr:hypothetical protein [Clostridia bacterium]
MKLVRAIFSVAVSVALVLGGIYLYRSCGAFSCEGTLMTAQAADTSESILLELQKDPDFKIADYPYTENDLSLHLFQIAESTDGQLYVYVYHPGGWEDKRVLALHLNLSTTHINGTPSGYNFFALTPIAGEKTVYKYAVDDFTVKSDAVRYYDIASITRSFIAGVDEEPGGDNVITEKAYPVGQAWTATGMGEHVKYSMITRDVVDVTSKYVAAVKFPDTSTYNHIIAFTADRTFDELYEAELIYTKQDVKLSKGSNKVLWKGSQIDVTDVIVADHKETVTTPNGNKNVYSWEKIQTSKACVDGWTWNEDAPAYSENKGIRANVLQHDWVIRFLTTSYKEYLDDPVRPTGTIAERTQVFDTCILRLKYETAGIVYDLGAVDDVQSGKLPEDSLPSADSGCDADIFAALWAWLKRIGAFIRKFWEFFLIASIVIAVGIVVIAVMKWGFSQKR